jgi:hypothetical protein
MAATLLFCRVEDRRGHSHLGDQLAQMQLEEIADQLPHCLLKPLRAFSSSQSIAGRVLSPIVLLIVAVVQRCANAMSKIEDIKDSPVRQVL